MKFRKSLLLATLPLALTSCFGGGSSSFYKKTFSYKGGVCYNLSSDSNNYQKSLESIIKEQMSADNIDWDNSGYVSDYVFFSTTTEFSTHDTYSNLISGMEKDITASFDKIYKDFKLTVSTYAEKTATFTLGDVTETVSLEGYNDDSEEAYYLYMKKDGESVGYFTAAAINGYGWRNGKLDCLEFSYGYTSRIRCRVSFKTEVLETSSMDWYVYAKIKN